MADDAGQHAEQNAATLIELMVKATMTFDGIIREHGGPLEAAYAGLSRGERRSKVNERLKELVEGPDKDKRKDGDKSKENQKSLDDDLLEISKLAKTWSVWQNADGKLVNDACYRIRLLLIALDENEKYLSQLSSKMEMRIDGVRKSLMALDERLQVALRIWQAEARYGWNDKQLDIMAGLKGHVGKIKRCQIQCRPDTQAKLYWVLGISNSDQLPDIPLATEVQEKRGQLAEVAGQLNAHNLEIALQQAKALLSYQRSIGRPGQPGKIVYDPDPIDISKPVDISRLPEWVLNPPTKCD